MAKSKKEKEAAPEKEHKKNWREVYASVEDIERYLSDHIQLRHNVITRREHPFDYPAIYAQAYGLYRQGFRYWFSQAEIQQLACHNEAFMAPVQEFELVRMFFRKPEHKGEGDFTPVAAALQMISCRLTGGIVGRLSPAMIGRAFTQLGFDSRIRHGLKGYIAVKRDDGQIKEYLNSLIGTGGADDEPF